MFLREKNGTLTKNNGTLAIECSANAIYEKISLIYEQISLIYMSVPLRLWDRDNVNSHAETTALGLVLLPCQNCCPNFLLECIKNSYAGSLDFRDF